MKKLLFLTTRIFWPTDSGRKVSLYHYCKGLHDVCGYEIYLYSFTESGQGEELLDNKPEFIKDVKLAKPVKKISKLGNLLGKSLFCYAPFQSALFYSKENAKLLRKYLEEVQPDVVIVDMIRLAQYYSVIKKFDCLKILDLDDLLSKRYKRQAKAKKANAQIFGAYSQNNSKLINNSFVKKAVLKGESRRIAKAEKKYSKKYDKVIFVSQNETDELNKLLGETKAYTVRLGVDYDYFSATDTTGKEEGAISFLGNLKVPANVDSLELIVMCLLPKLNFNYKVYVIGAVPEDIKEKFADARIEFLGRVDDVRPVIGKTQLFLSPIAYGSGIKTKILEAMAMGVPVVTNSIGAEGIDGQNGKHFFISDDIDGLAKLANDVVSGILPSNEVAESGKMLMKEKYDWNVIYASLVDLGL